MTSFPEKSLQQFPPLSSTPFPAQSRGPQGGALSPDLIGSGGLAVKFSLRTLLCGYSSTYSYSSDSPSAAGVANLSEFSRRPRLWRQLLPWLLLRLPPKLHTSKYRPRSPRNQPCFLPGPWCSAGGMSTQLMRTGSGAETDLPSLFHPEPFIWQSWKSRSRMGDTPSPRNLVTNQSSNPSLLTPRFHVTCQMPSSWLTLKKTQTHQTDDSERGVPHHRGLRPSQQHSPRALTGGFC